MVRAKAQTRQYMDIKAVMSHQRAALRMSDTRPILKIFANLREKRSRKSMYHDLEAQVIVVARAVVTSQATTATSQATTATGQATSLSLMTV